MQTGKKLDEAALNMVSGGVGSGAGGNQGVDGEAAHTVQQKCDSDTCKGAVRIFDCYSGGRAKCRVCGKEIMI